MSDKLNEKSQIGNLSGHARPTGYIRGAMQELHGIGTTIPLTEAMDDALAIKSLAALLEDTLKRSQRPDGTIDFVMQSAYIISTMRKL